MRKDLKRKGSHEGSGLSISTEPSAWREINSFTGGNTFELTKKANQFLDAYSLAEKEKKAIEAWGMMEGYIKASDIYRICYFDDEMDMDLEVVVDDLESAKEESENYGVDITTEKGYVSTIKMDTRVFANDKTIMPLDLLLTIYAEDVLSIDGIWWNEVLDVSRYSAPRGVIFNKMLPSWNSRMLDVEADLIVDDYLHGDCHIFAMALNLEFGYPIQFAIDSECIETESEVLIHAYCIKDDKAIDAGGVKAIGEILKEYDYNDEYMIDVPLEEFEEFFSTGFLHKPEENQVNKVGEYIRKNIDKYII